MKRTLTVLLLLSCLTVHASDINNDIVKIYAVQDKPSYYLPWLKRGPEQCTGSGAIIKGRKILTNAHVVSDSTFIQVRRNGQSQRFSAHVESISHVADLAILTVEDEGFYADAGYLEFGDLPRAQQEVTVYGFPEGGDTMSITKGVVSRVEHQVYVHSGFSLLAVQIDAAINPGNSGGPAVVDGRIAGIAMMKPRGTENISYIVPSTVIQHFLADIKDGRMGGFPDFGIEVQETENPDLQRCFKIPLGQSGALVAKVYPGGEAEGLLKVGDVITKLDDQQVAGDCTVEIRKGERTLLTLILQKHQIGEPLKVDYLRDGHPGSVRLTLVNRMGAFNLVPKERYDVNPTYYIYGGLVFCPLTTSLLQTWGENWTTSAPRNLLSFLDRNAKDGRIDEVVVMLRVLPSDLNRGYHGITSFVVKKVDGREIRNLKELIAITENQTNQFVRCEDADGNMIVLDRERVKKVQGDILKTYDIARDRSDDLLKTYSP